MSSTRRTLLLVQSLRKFSQSAIRSSGVTEVPSSKFNKLKEIQKKFAVEDGLPVHIKGGFTDKALYQFTVLLTLIGIGLTGETLFKLAYK